MRALRDWTSFADGGYPSAPRNRRDGRPAVGGRSYEPCFSKTFSAFLLASFSLR